MLGIGLLVCALLGSRMSAAQDVYPSDAWSRPPPAELAAWEANGLKDADALARSMQTDAYMVVHRGRLIHAFGDISVQRNVYSVRKSMLSVLFGIYVDRGVIDLSQSLNDLGVDDVGGLSAREQSATVRQLLQARSGVYHEAAYETRSAKAERPARGSHAPGSFWYYNNWDFNTLGGIFQQKTGKTVFESFHDELAVPLQFEDFRPSHDTEFVTEPASRYPAYVMKLSARDLARVGLLMARNGRWRDRQLISPAWVAQSTSPHSLVPPGWQSYGYMWWTPRAAWPFWRRANGDVFFAWGNGGQFLFVDRGRDLVIVHQADRRWLFSNEVTPESIAPLLKQIVLAVPGQ